MVNLNHKIFIEMNDDFKKSFKQYTNDLNFAETNDEIKAVNNELIKTLTSLLKDKYNPEYFNTKRVEWLNLKIHEQGLNQQKTINRQVKFKGKKNLIIEIDNNALIKKVSSKGKTTDDKRIIKYHNQMLNKVIGLGRQLDKATTTEAS